MILPILGVAFLAGIALPGRWWLAVVPVASILWTTAIFRMGTMVRTDEITLGDLGLAALLSAGNALLGAAVGHLLRIFAMKMAG